MIYDPLLNIEDNIASNQLIMILDLPLLNQEDDIAPLMVDLISDLFNSFLINRLADFEVFTLSYSLKETLSST